MNKSFLNKFYLFLIIMSGFFIFIPNTVIAATNMIQMKHKTNVSVDKVWKIKFNQRIDKDTIKNNISINDVEGNRVYGISLSYDSSNNTVKVQPPVLGYKKGRTYSLHIYETIRSVNNNGLKTHTSMNFTTVALDERPTINDGFNKEYIYKKYNKTLNEIVDKEYNCTTKQLNYFSADHFSNASKQDIKEYIDSKKIEKDNNGIYQFLTLNYIKGIIAEDLNKLLGGALAGQGKTFLDACEKYDVNPAYAVAHARLETGNGTSALAKGVGVTEVGGKRVERKTTYNMFGIGAFDENAVKLGSEKAYNEGWFTPEAAIAGGVKYISSSYINNDAYKQNTLYEIRWNPANPGTHQYATDIGWAYKQIKYIKQILDKCKNAYLVFEIPQYK